MLLNRNTFPFLYTVVVSRNDIRGKNQPRYILRTCYVQSLTEAGKDAAIFEDGKAAIYINASYSNEKDDSILAALIHDFKCKNPEDMRINTLKQHSIIVKNTEKGWDRMNQEMHRDNSKGGPPHVWIR